MGLLPEHQILMSEQIPCSLSNMFYKSSLLYSVNDGQSSSFLSVSFFHFSFNGGNSFLCNSKLLGNQTLYCNRNTTQTRQWIIKDIHGHFFVEVFLNLNWTMAFEQCFHPFLSFDLFQQFFWSHTNNCVFHSSSISILNMFFSLCSSGYSTEYILGTKLLWGVSVYLSCISP